MTGSRVGIGLELGNAAWEEKEKNCYNAYSFTIDGLHTLCILSRS
jgi:hypothetical protein